MANKLMATPKYTIRICYDVKGWAYYRRACALAKYAPADFEVTMGPDYGAAFRAKPHDLVLQLCFPYAKDIKQHIDDNELDIALVTGFNIGFGYANDWLEPCRQWSDHVLVNNCECWERLGRPENTSWISNGVDRELYPLAVPADQRTAKAIWTGSEFHRGVKGYDEYLLPLAEKLRGYGIECDFRLVDSVDRGSYRTQQEMADWYNTGTIYVVASAFEGTPNPALEAASAGCVIVSTPVGNMPELIDSGVNGELVERDVDAMFTAIIRCQERYVEMSNAMQTAIAVWDWKHRAGEYFKLFRTLIREQRKAALLPPTSSNHEDCATYPGQQKKAAHLASEPCPVPFTILSYCSEDYWDSFRFSINSWLKTSANRIVVYTDFAAPYQHDRVTIVPHFGPSNDWIANVGRKIETAVHFLGHDPSERVAFLDIDCFAVADFAEVFEQDFDLAVTRLFSTEAYTNGTVTCGVWFAHTSERLLSFFRQWEDLAGRYRAEGKGVAPSIIAYDQYSFTKLVRDAYENRSLSILPVSERLYNCEHSDTTVWKRYVAECRPKIIHFKGRSFRNPGFVSELCRLADVDAPAMTHAAQALSTPRKWGSHIPLVRTALKHLPAQTIVECGMGLHSTSLLVESEADLVISYEHDAQKFSRLTAEIAGGMRFMPKFIDLGHEIDARTLRAQASDDQLYAMNSAYERIAAELADYRPIDILLIDTFSAARLPALENLHGLAQTIIFHDSEPANYYGYCYDQFIDHSGRGYQRYSFRPTGAPWTELLTNQPFDVKDFRWDLQASANEFFGDMLATRFVTSLS